MNEVLLNVSFEWNLKPTPEFVTKLEQYYGQKIKLDEDGTLSWQNRNFQLNLEELQDLNVKFEVNSFTNLTRHIPNIEQRTSPGPVNIPCNVSIAGVSMLHIIKVQVFVDCCTDKLQDLLTAGWRILAICVQPDQRRPDYVLGTSNPELL